MRSYIVSLLLLISVGLFLVLQLTRDPREHIVTAGAGSGRGSAAAPGSARGSGRGSAVTARRGSGHGSGSGKVAVRGRGPHRPKAKTTVVKPPKPRMKRPLRVVGLNWELLAPAFVANDGAKSGKGSLFAKDRLQVELLSAGGTTEIVQSALASGGAGKHGADIAVLPLPAFVAAYEQLRALDPQIIFVVGWSRGRHGLMVKPGVRLTRLPRRTSLVGRLGDTATFFALFVLDLAGLPPNRVKIVPRAQQKKAKKAPFIAGRRPLAVGANTGGRRFVVSTADASQLIPIVAVAPRGFIAKHRDALTVWGNTWLAGIDKLRENVAGAARRIAGSKGAPGALDLLKRLGQYEPVNLRDNARLAGLSGRSPVTLALLFARCWRIWRAAGLLSSPPPQKAPLSVRTLASLVGTYPGLVEAAPTGGAAAAAGARGKPTAAGAGRLLLAYRPRLTRKTIKQLLAGEIGTLAGIFPRLGLRVALRRGLRHARRAVARAKARYDLPRPERITASGRRPRRRLARIELLGR